MKRLKAHPRLSLGIVAGYIAFQVIGGPLLAVANVYLWARVAELAAR